MSNPSRSAGVGALGEQVGGADSAEATSSLTKRWTWLRSDSAEPKTGNPGSRGRKYTLCGGSSGTRSHQARQGSPTSMSTAASHQSALVRNYGNLAGGANGTEGRSTAPRPTGARGVARRVELGDGLVQRLVQLGEDRAQGATASLALMAVLLPELTAWAARVRSVRIGRRNTSVSEVAPPTELETCPEDADEVGADTAAVPEALADGPEAGVVGSADLADLPDLAEPLAVLLADLAALLDLAVRRALLADLATGRGGLDAWRRHLHAPSWSKLESPTKTDASGLSTEPARQRQESTERLASPPTPRRPSRTTHRSQPRTACEVGETTGAPLRRQPSHSNSTDADWMKSQRGLESEWSQGDSASQPREARTPTSKLLIARAFKADARWLRTDPVIEGAGATVEVDSGDAAELRGARRDDPAAALVGDLRAGLDVDPAKALVACGEVRRVDGRAELAEPAETAGRGRAVDSGAEVTTIEETKPAELVTGAADAADPERGTGLDAGTYTDGRVTGVKWSRRNGLSWTRRGFADGTWKSAGVIANPAADVLEVGAAELSGKETGAELGDTGPMTRSVISRTSLGWT
ncbi:unnamed protein product [Phytophthora fragariaefolia]|uniref:Unnamed protein product n=1 Tax=Phytophthora fragariaefolia TaxID=1490495 RepID=A0A9W6XWG4_9STRA|nr:unnamed protein product [Phytophthora fragariaefolia]